MALLDPSRLNALLALTLIYIAASFFMATKYGLPFSQWSLNLKEFAAVSIVAVLAALWYFFYNTNRNDMVQGYYIITLCLAFASMAYSLTAKKSFGGEVGELEYDALTHSKPQMLPVGLSVATFVALYTYFQGMWSLRTLGVTGGY